jgi:hypothetical protein
MKNGTLQKKIKGYTATGISTELYRNEERYLSQLGFNRAGKDITGQPKWRLKVPYYNYEIQLVLGPYPKANPNCGILSLYTPAEKAEVFTGRNGRKKVITFPEFERPIAWYVDTADRLRNLIVSLTSQNI